MKIFDDNEDQAGNIEKDDEEKDKENIYIFFPDSYSHMVAIMHMCWKE